MERNSFIDNLKQSIKENRCINCSFYNKDDIIFDILKDNKQPRKYHKCSIFDSGIPENMKSYCNIYERDSFKTEYELIQLQK